MNLAMRRKDAKRAAATTEYHGRGTSLTPQMRRHRQPLRVDTSPCRPNAVLGVTLLMWLMALGAAEKDSNSYPWGENPNNQFKMYWNNAQNVYQDLDKFSALYIKYHGCVWSECTVDNYDDDGENRDGDENWYQYRTQTFCANAAYSLYGVLKSQSGFLPSFHLSSCSRRTYINSFFTYGGADTVMEALGLQATTSLDSYGTDYTSSHPNAVCYAVDGENNQNQNQNQNNNQNQNYGTSSTMGCSNDKSFAVAEFSGQTCDGNYFLQTLNDAKEYNRAMNGVRCRQIWNYRKHYSGSSSSSSGNRRLESDSNEDSNSSIVRTETLAGSALVRRITQAVITEHGRDLTYANPAEALLSNSWACDISVYPHGCPDPFGLKKRYDAVMAAVSSGRSSRMAVTNARLHVPIIVVSIAALLSGIGLLLAAYFVSNQARIRKLGLLATVRHDLKKTVASSCRVMCTMMATVATACWACCSGAARRQRKLRRHQRREQKLQEKMARMEEKKKRHRRHLLVSRRSGSYGNSFLEESEGEDSSRQRPASTGRQASRGTASSFSSRSMRSSSRRRATSLGRAHSRSRSMHRAAKDYDTDGSLVESNTRRYPSG